MKTPKYQSAKDDPAHIIEKAYAYEKCYMYRALMIVGDFGANLLTPAETFRRWADRANSIASSRLGRS